MAYPRSALFRTARTAPWSFHRPTLPRADLADATRTLRPLVGPGRASSPSRQRYRPSATPTGDPLHAEEHPIRPRIRGPFGLLLGPGSAPSLRCESLTYGPGPLPPTAIHRRMPRTTRPRYPVPSGCWVAPISSLGVIGAGRASHWPRTLQSEYSPQSRVPCLGRSEDSAGPWCCIHRRGPRACSDNHETTFYITQSGNDLFASHPATTGVDDTPCPRSRSGSGQCPGQPRPDRRA